MMVLFFAGALNGWAENLLGLKNVKFDSSLEISGQSANNETDVDGTDKDTRGATVTRLRIGMNAVLSQDVSTRIEAVRNSDSGPFVSQYGDGASTVANEEGAIALQNAYLDFDNFLNTDEFRIGRQYGGRTGDLLVYYGPVYDDALTVQAFDSVYMAKKFKKINATFVTGKVVEDDLINNTDEGDVVGDITASWLILNSDEIFESVKVPLELGYYRITNQRTDTIADNMTLSIIDLRASYTLQNHPVTLSAEYAMNDGKYNTNHTGTDAMELKGNAYVLKANYDNEDKGFGWHLVYANASGDDQNEADQGAQDDSFHDLSMGGYGWAVSDFSLGEILSNSNALAVDPVGANTTVTGDNIAMTSQTGLDTGFGGYGLNVINLGGYYNMTSIFDGKITAYLDYYMVKVNEVVSGADDGVGSEIDLTFTYDHSKSIKAALGYAMFSPDSGFANEFTDPTGFDRPEDTITKFFGKLMIKWGAAKQRVF